MVADTIKKKRCPVVEQRLAKKDEVRKLIYRLLFRKRWREEIWRKRSRSVVEILRSVSGIVSGIVSAIISDCLRFICRFVGHFIFFFVVDFSF